MNFIRSLFIFISLFTLVAAPSAASAGFRDRCHAFAGSLFNLMQEDRPISEQWIAANAKAKTDMDIALQWLWRENDKTETTAGGFNIADKSSVELLLSISNWKSLTNAEIRSLLRVQTALFTVEFLIPKSFSQAMRMVSTTAEDVATWERILPDRPLPKD